MMIHFSIKELKEGRKQLMKNMTKQEIRAQIDSSFKEYIRKYIDKYIQEIVEIDLLSKVKRIVTNELKNQTIKVEKVTAKEIIDNIDIKRIEREIKDEIIKKVSILMKSLKSDKK